MRERKIVQRNWEDGSTTTIEFWIEKETVFKIDYDHVTDMVFSLYGLENYCFIAAQECGNDTTHEFQVTGKLDEWSAKEAAKIRAGKPAKYLSNDTLMNMLCEDGYLEPGTYLVKVCW